jgi:hypothetical protein
LQRDEHLLASLLGNADAVARFILMLVQDPSESLGAGAMVIGPGGEAVDDRSGETPATVFEPIVRALHEDPTRLDDVNRLIDDLRKIGAVQDRLPPEWNAIWDPVWQARKELVRDDVT